MDLEAGPSAAVVAASGERLMVAPPATPHRVTRDAGRAIRRASLHDRLLTSRAHVQARIASLLLAARGHGELEGDEDAPELLALRGRERHERRA